MQRIGSFFLEIGTKGDWGRAMTDSVAEVRPQNHFCPHLSFRIFQVGKSFSHVVVSMTLGLSRLGFLGL